MNLPEVGQIVRFTRKTARYGRGMEVEECLGKVIYIWSMNAEDDCTVKTDNGSFHPGLGDTWWLADGGA